MNKQPRKRNPIAADLHKPKYRQRIKPNRKLDKQVKLVEALLREMMKQYDGTAH